jgi:hypothetical protein
MVELNMSLHVKDLTSIRSLINQTGRYIVMGLNVTLCLRTTLAHIEHTRARVVEMLSLYTN